MPRIRIHFSKRGKAVFVPHVDLPILFARAARRGGLAMEMTEGFSPHPKTEFGPPLPVGVIGLSEPAEFRFTEFPEGSFEAFASHLPEGISLLDARECSGLSLGKLCTAASYIIEPRNDVPSEVIAEGLEIEFRELGSLLDIAVEGREIKISVSDLERSGASRMVKKLTALSIISGWKDLSIVRLRVGRWDVGGPKVVPLTEE